MRISKFTIIEEATNQRGLQNIDIHKLGAVVALVGRNGSGKSRILSLLRDYPNLMPNLDYLSFSHFPELFKKHEGVLTNNQAYLNAKLDKDKLASWKLASPDFVNAENAVNEALNFIKYNYSRFVRKIEYATIHNLQSVISPPKIPNSQQNQMSFEQMIGKISQGNDYNEIQAISSTALSYLTTLPHQIVDSYIEALGNQELFEQSIPYKRYASLKKIIKSFLNKDLKWEKKTGSKTLTESGLTAQIIGSWTLNNRPFNYNELSDGEKNLFAYSLLFFLLDQNPNIQIKDCIIIIDEPELHLHPSSELALIRGIRNIIQDSGQLWIATHSLSILSDLSYDEIFMVKDNTIISPSKTTPGETLIELMELEEHIERLSYFVGNIANWSFLNFMTQCFSDPDVIQSAQPNDPEVEAFITILKSKSTANILLDFGAGQGRLYNAIVQDETLKSKLKYYALDTDEKNLTALSGLNLEGLYNNYNDIGNEVYDYVILCNVLHEIEVGQWSNILNKIKMSLKKDGVIIIMEDLKLPKGEKIGETGFLIMDADSLKELFSMTEKPSEIYPREEKYRDRILCALIQKKQIMGISDSTIKKALNILQNNTLEKIRNNRKKDITSENRLSLGREAAFYSQLYINAKLTIEKLKEAEKAVLN
ncbi:MAG: methyltransferase protein [Bacteroidetes bacterium]|nr:methyltransferase protein [Bacteroidota bacterium]